MNWRVRVPRYVVDKSLQLLYGHEIDRIVAWHNPLGTEERRLPSERQFSLDARLQALPGNETMAAPAALGAAEWSRTMSVAWAVDPALAVAVWQQRFRSVGHATTALSRLVLADPAAVRMLPSAVEALITPETVAANAPQLRQLLLWAPASIPVVIGLLSRCSYADASAAPPPLPLFTHPLVAAYAVRCLRRFSADTVVFYLPQLVQGLRHDRTGQLADLLYEISQSTMAIAHQLIWLLLSESKAGGEGGHGREGAAAAGGGGGAAAGAKSGEGIVSSLSLDAVEDVGGGAPDDDAPPARGHGFQHQLPGHDTLPGRAVSLMRRVVETFPPTARALFELQV